MQLMIKSQNSKKELRASMSYLLNDTSQLLDWALLFGNTIHNACKIYPFAGVCSTAGTAYYSGLLSIIKSEQADIIHEMFNKGLFGGIAAVSMKKVEAEWGYSIIIPFDANALYPSNMQLWVPIGAFKLIENIDEDQIS
eukprot:TRINITY_DN3121_c0_g1_i2.p1 TRINITY_DN3121_c0_g1~~TRINITY_DN3121_c0_g1_i2.p1  ORF type:complete len:139 (+),score=21.47 TRINITY_DN3121_c0_g1_i2:639-1055(+)